MEKRLSAAVVAECIGSFMLTFIGIMAIYHAKEGAGLLSVAIAHGLALAIGVTATMAISGGHLNPAVTIGFLVTGKMKPAEAVAYILAQLAGGVIAALAVYSLVGADAVHDGTPNLGVVFKGVPTSSGVAVLAEIFATFLLVMAVWGSAVDPRHPNVGGFAIGLTICADILAVGPITGASMNPQRSFGPTLVASFFGKAGDLWPHHWVYWVGPVAGACIAAWIYNALLMPRDAR